MRRHSIERRHDADAAQYPVLEALLTASKRDRMGGTEPHAYRYSAGVGREHHFSPGLDVIAVRHRVAYGTHRPGDSVERYDFGERHVVARQIALDAVRERIDPGRGREPWGKADRKFGVQYRHARKEMRR